MSIWTVAADGRKTGGVSNAQLLAMARDGRLRPGDLVWREGLAQWVPARSVKGLFPDAPAAPGGAAPPPLPSPTPLPVAAARAPEAPAAAKEERPRRRATGGPSLGLTAAVLVVGVALLAGLAWVLVNRHQDHWAADNQPRLQRELERATILLEAERARDAAVHFQNLLAELDGRGQLAATLVEVHRAAQRGLDDAHEVIAQQDVAAQAMQRLTQAVALANERRLDEAQAAVAEADQLLAAVTRPLKSARHAAQTADALRTQLNDLRAVLADSPPPQSAPGIAEAALAPTGPGADPAAPPAGAAVTHADGGVPRATEGARREVNINALPQEVQHAVQPREKRD